MDDPFYNLKDSIKKDFESFSFSEERKNAVKETIRKKQSHLELHSWKIETLQNILDALQDEAKHGYEISTQLFQINELSFKNNEDNTYKQITQCYFNGKSIMTIIKNIHH